MFNHNVRAMTVAAVLAVLSATAHADEAHGSTVYWNAETLFEYRGSGPLATGTIQRLEVEDGQVTIVHGPLPSLGMGGSTTAFLIRDPAMFESIQTGQRVRFAAERVDGLYTVTRVEAVPPMAPFCHARGSVMSASNRIHGSMLAIGELPRYPDRLPPPHSLACRCHGTAP